MKIKKLTIDNIASIEHAEIDFGSTPLADERLFLISGETGSGKSTIIDCLCLALYGTTPRLKGARSATYDSGIAGTDKEDKIVANNPKQLMRRGCVKGSVELTFDDDNGVSYLATWEVHRAHNKMNGRLLDATRTLRTTDNSTPAVDLCKTREIDEHIEKLIGLNVNQFFRTVVLAQGKFAEFLNSSEHDKGVLLEKMTGTEVYARLGKKIYETWQQKVNHCSFLKAQMDNIILLDEGQKAALNEELAQCGSEQTAVDGLLKRAVAQLQWVKDKRRLENSISAKSDELNRQTATTRSETHLAEQRLVADWETSADARHHLQEQRDADVLIGQLQQRQPAIQEEFDYLCAALRATVADLADKQSQVIALDEAIARDEDNKTMYEAMDQIKGLLKRWQKTNKDIVDYTRDLEVDKGKLQPVKDQVLHAQEAVKEIGREIGEIQACHEALNTTAINREKDVLNKAVTALSALRDKHDAVAEASQAIASLKEQLAQAETTLTAVSATIEGKRALRDKAKENVDRQTGWNELLIQAQKTVHVGDTCPVCGNTITQVLVPKAESELEQLRQEYKQAEEDLNQAEGQVKVNEQLINNYKKQIGEGQIAFEKKKDDRENSWQQLRPLLEQCGYATDGMMDKDHADALIFDIGKQAEQLNVRLDTAAGLARQIQTEQKRLAVAQEACHKAELALNKLKDNIKHQGELIEKCRNDIVSLERDLDALLVMENWREHALADGDFVKRLQQAADGYRKAVAERQQLAQLIELRSAAIPAMEQSKSNMMDLTDNGHKTDSVPDDLGNRWRTLENQHVQLKAQLVAARETAAKAQQSLDAHLAAHPETTLERIAELSRYPQETIAGIKQSHQSLNDAIVAMKGAVDTLNKQLTDLVARRPDFVEDNADRLEEIITEKQGRLDSLITRIAELKAQLSADEENNKRMGSRVKELEEAETECQQWESLKSILGSADGDAFRTIAQSYILGELLSNANGYLRHFNNRYSLEPGPGTLVILVRDMVQGDVTSVNTLSGGESFMVSLALALALSSMTGKMFTVDTLFIDEGFGSLSPVYLDNVMETLNRLYDLGGRRVGIISHMEMLKERVPTQIKVFRAADNNTVSHVEVTTV